MRDNYRELVKEIHVPEGLNERVLETARIQHTANGTGKCTKMNRKPLLRAAVCAVLALILVLGGVNLRTTTNGVLFKMKAQCEVSYLPGLTVYAAERGVNGGVYLPEAENPDAVALEGTTQTLYLNFADGEQASGTYRLQTEELGSFFNEDGEAVLVPVLTGEAKTVTGLYAVPEDSIWFRWPVEGSNTVSLSNRYGFRMVPGGQGSSFHAGIDIPAASGTPICAVADGTVKETGFDTVLGNYLILDHGDGMETVYAHCLSLSEKMGDSVVVGQEIATVGSTGMSTGPHLHFGVRQDGKAQNPVAYFDSEIRDTLKMG